MGDTLLCAQINGSNILTPGYENFHNQYLIIKKLLSTKLAFTLF